MRIAAPLALIAFILSPAVFGQPHDNDLVPGSEHTRAIRDDLGSKGLAVFPADYSGKRLTRIVDPSGYRVHFTNADDPGEELIYPAGELFEPPTGRFRYWMEGAWSMTPFTELASFRPNRPAGAKSIRAMLVVPAGRVKLAAPAPVDSADQLRLLYAGWDPRDGVRHELTRRRAVSDIGEGLLMPSGTVLASLWDSRLGRYVALSRPFRVRAGETVEAPLQLPGTSLADLVVYVDRVDDLPASAIPGMALTATSRGKERTADVNVTTAWGVYGVWYGLPPGRVVVAGANKRSYLPPVEINLVGGQIARYQGKLLPQLFVDGGPPAAP